MEQCGFHIWLLSFNVMLSRFPHIVASISTAVPFLQLNNIPQHRCWPVFPILFFLPIMKNAARNISVLVWMSVFHFTQSEIVESYRSSMLNSEELLNFSTVVMRFIFQLAMKQGSFQFLDSICYFPLPFHCSNQTNVHVCLPSIQ